MKGLRLFAALAFGGSLLFLGLGFIGVLPWRYLALIGLVSYLVFLLALRSRRNLPGDLILTGIVGLTLLAAWLGHEALWLFLANLCALSAWDARRFINLLAAQDVLQEGNIVRLHMQRLGSVAVVSAVLAVFAMHLKLQLNLWIGLILGVVLSLGLKHISGLAMGTSPHHRGR